MDTFKIPKGYILIKDPEVEKKETLNKLKQEISDRIKEYAIPSNDELIELGKLSHPYYMDKARLDELNG